MKKTLKILAAIVLAAIIVIGSYAAYVFIAYYRLPDMQQLDVTGGGDVALTGVSYKALSYNIGFGAYSDDFGFFMDGGEHARGYSAQAVAGNVTGALDTAEAAGVDVIFFQEVDVRGHRSRDVDQRAMVYGRFEGLSIAFAQNYDSPYLCYPLGEPIGSAEAGIMTVTGFGITDALRRSLPIDEGFMKLLDLDRCYSVCRVPVEGGGELVMYNVHLSAYTADESIVRSQLEMLSEDMAGEYAAGNYVVCGGDFNCDLLGNSAEIFGVAGDFSWAQPFNAALLPEGFSLVAPFSADAPVPSARNADGPYAPGESFVITLDGFIVSPNVQVLGADVVDTGFRYSDHNPVYIEFVLLPR